MMDDADIGRVEAVLDWEMTTIGDPLVDVGLSLCYWSSGIAGGPSRDVSGWYTRDQFIQEYAAAPAAMFRMSTGMRCWESSSWR